MDPSCNFQHWQLERVGERLERALRELIAHGEIAARERSGRDVAERDVGVRDGRLRAAASVAGGARIGARAQRPDVQPPGRVQPRDAAAARAHLRDVDRWNPDQLAAPSQEPAT